LAGPAALCRPHRERSRAHPRGKPGFLTHEGRLLRETDSLLEGAGFEPSVPRLQWSSVQLAARDGTMPPSRSPERRSFASTSSGERFPKAAVLHKAARSGRVCRRPRARAARRPADRAGNRFLAVVTSPNRDLTSEKMLAHSRLPLAWLDQRTALGFAYAGAPERPPRRAIEAECGSGFLIVYLLGLQALSRGRNTD
jgi:hypothetical protein